MYAHVNRYGKYSFNVESIRPALSVVFWPIAVGTPICPTEIGPTNSSRDKRELPGSMQRSPVFEARESRDESSSFASFGSVRVAGGMWSRDGPRRCARWRRIISARYGGRTQDRYYLLRKLDQLSASLFPTQTR